jgi:hypothetical protein
MHVPADRKNLSELLLANYKLGSQAGKPDSVLEKSISSVEIMGSVPKEAGPLMKALGITILNNVQ